MDIRCNQCKHEYQADSMGYCPRCGSSDQSFFNLPEVQSDAATIATLTEQLAEAARQYQQLQTQTGSVIEELQEKLKTQTVEHNAELGNNRLTIEELTKEKAELQEKLDAAGKKGDKK